MHRLEVRCFEGYTMIAIGTFCITFDICPFNKQHIVENRSYQLTNAGRFANHGQMGWHWLAGNSYFPRRRIFIFCFSGSLGINIEVLNSLLLGKGLFI